MRGFLTIILLMFSNVFMTLFFSESCLETGGFRTTLLLLLT